MEIWKEIPGFEGRYEASSNGSIRGISSLLEKKQKINRDGYLRVNLNVNGKPKTYTVHRLVASTFIPNPNCLPMINHKDENKLNNCIDNLEWCDNKYNTTYGNTISKRVASLLEWKAKDKPILQCDLEGKVIARFDSARQAAKILGLRKQRINFILNGMNGCKTCGGFSFKYE